MNQINVTAGSDATYAMVGKKLIAVRWRAGDRWYVGGPGHEPACFDGDRESDAVGAFLAITLAEPGSER